MHTFQILWAGKISKPLNRNLMGEKKKKVALVKKLFSKYELSGEVEQQRY